MITDSTTRGRTEIRRPKTKFAIAGRSQSPRTFHINSNIRDMLKESALQKSRSYHDALTCTLEERRGGRALNDDEKKVALYFAFQSDGAYHRKIEDINYGSIDEYMGVRGYFSEFANINAFYAPLNPAQKAVFHEIKEILAEKAYNYFEEKGWIKPTDAVADLFSGADAAFAKYATKRQSYPEQLRVLKVNGQEGTDAYKALSAQYLAQLRSGKQALLPSMLAIDQIFKKQYEARMPISEKQKLIKEHKLEVTGIDLFQQPITRQEAQEWGKKDFIYMAAPVLPFQQDDHSQVNTLEYHQLIDNLLTLSKPNANIVMGMHVNNAMVNPEYVSFSKFCTLLSQDRRFDYELIDDPEGQFDHLIHLKVKDKKATKKSRGKKK